MNLVWDAGNWDYLSYATEPNPNWFKVQVVDE